MGTTSTYSAGGLDELRSSISGRIIQPGDAGTTTPAGSTTG